MNILYVSNTDGALYNFRKDLIQNRINKNDAITSITSPSSPEGSYIGRLIDLGVKSITVPFASKNIVKQWECVKTIYIALKSLKPEIVHSFAHQANILTFLAYYFTCNRPAKMIFTITGLGRAFSSNNIVMKPVRLLVMLIYKLSYKYVHTIFFLNRDDLEYFNSFIGDSKKMVHIYGEGISEIPVIKSPLQENQFIDFTTTNEIICLFAARLMRSKGVVEFITAAQFLTTKYPGKFEFIIAGSLDSSISESELIKCIDNNKHIQYIGYVNDALNLINTADIIVLPSYYREGVPRILIEGLMLGKLIITTDMPGCRDTVLEGKNGYLVKTKSVDSIIDCLSKIDISEIRSAFHYSKELFRSKFSSQSINRVIERHYEL